MTAERKTSEREPASSRAATSAPTPARKLWKKRTATEVVLDQINRQREDVARKQAEYEQAKRQLVKLEEARKILEAT